MSEDGRTLWIGNLHENVTEELLFELFLQTGPIERLILPADGEGDNKKHKGHAYVLFHHPESVPYASQVLEESSLFGNTLSLKARSFPAMYKMPNKGRSDNPYKPGFNKAATWHGQNDFSSRGRGSFSGRGRGSSNYTQNSGFNNYNNQSSSGSWASGQQSSTDNTTDEKRQRLAQQQNTTLSAHRQVQQGPMPSQTYGVTSQQQTQQQGAWANNGYNTNWGNTSGGGGNTAAGYQNYTTDQYGNWYQQQ